MIPDHTPHPDPTLDQWLTINHTALINALDEVLDLDTGLTDATLTTHYDTLTADLDHVLDVNTGLQDIQASPPQPTPKTTDRAAGVASLTDYAHHVATRPAHERLAARTWFPQHELTALQAISAALNDLNVLVLIRAQALDLTRARSLDRARAQALVRDLARALARALAHVDALIRASDLALSLVRELVRNRALDLVSALALVRTLALDLDLGRVFDRVVIHDLDRVSDHDLGFALVSALGRDQGRDRDLDPDLYGDRPLDLVRDLAFERVRALGDLVRAVDLGDVLARAWGNIAARTRDHLLALDNNDLAASLADVLAHAHTLVSQDLNTALTQLEQALTDVTGADLTHANLNGVPLDGVLWSSNTRWPSHLQEQIRQSSVPIGPDLYRISSRSTGKDTFVDQNF